MVVKDEEPRALPAIPDVKEEIEDVIVHGKKN
jgi:hypothetical protein